MTLSQLQSFLLWGAGLNYALLVAFFFAWVLAGDAIWRLHSRWFDIERRTCDALAYLMMGLFKLAIWMFFIVPWLALCILRQQGGVP
jgi:hypothetical protein